MKDFEQLQIRCVSHEIRNHISICEMYSEIIKKHLDRDGYNNDSVNNALSCIKKSIKIIGTSLLDLKSMSNLVLKTCNLKNLLDESIKLASAYAQGRNIEFINKVNQSAEVNVDENKFLACIVNIIKNAVEAIEDCGFVEISLDINKNLACITISNNGKMISNPDEIFNEGFTTKKNGNGLGLLICKENLNAQNAELKLVMSTENLTKFEILLPIQ